MRSALLVVMICISSAVWSQEEELKFGDTEMTNSDPTYATDKREFRTKDKVELIFNHSKKLLEGNKCFEDYLEEKNIQLSSLTTGTAEMSGISRVLRNTGSRIRGTFRHGPFWVARLNKKRRECRNALHDFIG